LNLLREINLYDYTYNLYAIKLPLKEDSQILLDSDLYEIKESIDDFYYVMGIQDINDIVENLKLQTCKINVNQIIAAINYYIENDAFMEVTEN
jgi:hypothetical protein